MAAAGVETCSGHLLPYEESAVARLPDHQGKPGWRTGWKCGWLPGTCQASLTKFRPAWRFRIDILARHAASPPAWPDAARPAPPRQSGGPRPVRARPRCAVAGERRARGLDSRSSARLGRIIIVLALMRLAPSAASIWSSPPSHRKPSARDRQIVRRHPDLAAQGSRREWGRCCTCPQDAVATTHARAAR